MPLPPPELPALGSVARWARDLWRDVTLTRNPQRGRRIGVVTVLLVLAIGLLDFRAGFEISLFLFYCLPVVLGTAALGWKFGTVISFLSVLTALVGDYFAGAQYSSPAVPVWKGLLAITTYLIFVWLFDTVQTLQQEMQERVRQRTAALTAEIAERRRLERSLLEISERERASVGRELHDNLGQHLTGTAFAGQVLGEKLQALGLAEQDDAWKIVALIEEGIEKTRRLAKGLLLAEIQRDGLVDALRGFATEASNQFHLSCEFRLEGECRLTDSNTAMHLLRITQEAVNNAVRHGKARRLVIALSCQPDRVELMVRDNGTGLPAPGARNEGLGLHIMAHRAQIIGGEFFIETGTEGGTVVCCRLPQPPPAP
jgi:signal transduction histidine kinase